MVHTSVHYVSWLNYQILLTVSLYVSGEICACSYTYWNGNVWILSHIPHRQMAASCPNVLCQDFCKATLWTRDVKGLCVITVFVAMVAFFWWLARVRREEGWELRQRVCIKKRDICPLKITFEMFIFHGYKSVTGGQISLHVFVLPPLSKLVTTCYCQNCRAWAWYVDTLLILPQKFRSFFAWGRSIS